MAHYKTTWGLLLYWTPARPLGFCWAFFSPSVLMLLWGGEKGGGREAHLQTCHWSPLLRSFHNSVSVSFVSLLKLFIILVQSAPLVLWQALSRPFGRSALLLLLLCCCHRTVVQ